MYNQMLPIIYTVARQAAFAAQIASDFDQGTVIESQYPNGELALAIPENELKLHDSSPAVLVGSTDPADIVATVGLATLLTRRCPSLTLVLPYFRTSTQERWKVNKAGNQEVALARVMVNMLNTIPRARTQNTVILCDLHVSEIAGFFDPDRWRVKEVSLLHTVLSAVKKRCGEISRVLNPDSGREFFVMQAAEYLGVSQSGATKERVSGSEVHHHGSLSGASVQGQKVLILDDMIRSGSTAIGAAMKAREAGASELWLAAIHPDFTPEGLQNLQSSGLFKGVFVSDTWPMVQCAREHRDFVTVVPTTWDFRQEIRKVARNV